MCSSNRSVDPQLSADVQTLREALAEARDRNPGMHLLAFAAQLDRLLEAAEKPQAGCSGSCGTAGGCGGGCGGACESAAAPAPKPAEVVVRRMKAPPAEGPFTGEQIAQRVMRICGCQGRYDCNCVSVINQARIELWTEHNTQARNP